MSLAEHFLLREFSMSFNRIFAILSYPCKDDTDSYLAFTKSIFIRGSNTSPPPLGGLFLNNKKKKTFFIHQCPLSVKKLKDERKIRINHAITNK